MAVLSPQMDFAILALALVGTVALPATALFLIFRLAASVRTSLADTEALRSQITQALKAISTRAEVAEEHAQALLEAHRTLLQANTGLTARDEEVKYLRDANAHLQNLMAQSAHAAQARILALASPSAAEREVRMALGREYPSQQKDGFREFPPESSPIDTIRVPETDRENPRARTTIPPPPPLPTTSEEATFFGAQQANSPPEPSQMRFAEEEDVDQLFRTPHTS